MSASVEHWLSRLRPSTGRVAQNQFDLFLTWLRTHGGAFKDYTPDQLVAYQRKANNRIVVVQHSDQDVEVADHSFDLLNLVQHYIQTQYGRVATKKHKYHRLRSFFAHNRAALPPDKSFRIKGDLPPSQGQLTVEQVRNIVIDSNVMYRAVFLPMFQGGMGAGELLRWSDHGLSQLVADLAQHPDIIKATFPGGRKGSERAFYTFIAGDALEAVKTWMAERPDHGDAIFITHHDTPLSYYTLRSYWLQRVEDLNVATNPPRPAGRGRTRPGLNLHEMRDLFRSQWGKSPADRDAGEFFMGHNIDPLGYNKMMDDETFARNEYLKALPQLQIMSSGTPYHLVGEDEVDRLRREVARLQTRQDDIVELQAKLRVVQAKFEALRPVLQLLKEKGLILDDT